MAVQTELGISQKNQALLAGLSSFGITLNDAGLLSEDDLTGFDDLPSLLEMMLLDESLSSSLRQQIGVVLSLYSDMK